MAEDSRQALDKKTREVLKNKVSKGKENAALQSAQQQLMAIHAEQKQNLNVARAELKSDAGNRNALMQAGGAAAEAVAEAENNNLTTPAEVSPQTQAILGKYGLGQPKVQRSQSRSQQVTKQNVVINNNTTTTTNNNVAVPTGSARQGTTISAKKPSDSGSMGKFKTWLSGAFARQEEDGKKRDSEYKRREWSLTRSANKMMKKLEDIGRTFGERMDPRKIGSTWMSQLKTLLFLFGFGLLASNWSRILTLVSNIESGFKKLLEYLGIIGGSPGKTSGFIKDLKYLLGAENPDDDNQSLFTVFKELFHNEKNNGLFDMIKTYFNNIIDDRKKALDLVNGNKPSFASDIPGLGSLFGDISTYLGNILTAIISGTGGLTSALADTAEKKTIEKSVTTTSNYYGKFDSDTDLGDYGESNGLNAQGLDIDSSGKLASGRGWGAAWRQAQAIETALDDTKHTNTSVIMAGLNRLDEKLVDIKDAKNFGERMAIFPSDFLEKLANKFNINKDDPEYKAIEKWAKEHGKYKYVKANKTAQDMAGGKGSSFWGTVGARTAEGAALGTAAGIAGAPVSAGITVGGGALAGTAAGALEGLGEATYNKFTEDASDRTKKLVRVPLMYGGYASAGAVDLDGDGKPDFRSGLGFDHNLFNRLKALIGKSIKYNGEEQFSFDMANLDASRAIDSQLKAAKTKSKYVRGVDGVTRFSGTTKPEDDKDLMSNNVLVEQAHEANKRFKNANEQLERDWDSSQAKRAVHNTVSAAESAINTVYSYATGNEAEGYTGMSILPSGNAPILNKGYSLGSGAGAKNLNPGNRRPSKDDVFSIGRGSGNFSKYKSWADGYAGNALLSLSYLDGSFKGGKVAGRRNPTVEEVIYTWCPPGEDGNSKGAVDDYVKDVAKESGLGTQTPIPITFDNLLKLVLAKGKHDSGHVSIEEARDGVGRAWNHWLSKGGRPDSGGAVAEIQSHERRMSGLFRGGEGNATMAKVIQSANSGQFYSNSSKSMVDLGTDDYKGKCTSGPETFYKAAGIDIGGHWWKRSGQHGNKIDGTGLSEVGFDKVMSFDPTKAETLLDPTVARQNGLRPGDIMLQFGDGSNGATGHHAVMFTGDKWVSDTVQTKKLWVEGKGLLGNQSAQIYRNQKFQEGNENASYGGLFGGMGAAEGVKGWIQMFKDKVMSWISNFGMSDSDESSVISEEDVAGNKKTKYEPSDYSYKGKITSEFTNYQSYKLNHGKLKEGMSLTEWTNEVRRQTGEPPIDLVVDKDAEAIRQEKYDQDHNYNFMKDEEVYTDYSKYRDSGGSLNFKNWQKKVKENTGKLPSQLYKERYGKLPDVSKLLGTGQKKETQELIAKYKSAENFGGENVNDEDLDSKVEYEEKDIEQATTLPEVVVTAPKVPGLNEEESKVVAEGLVPEIAYKELSTSDSKLKEIYQQVQSRISKDFIDKQLNENEIALKTINFQDYKKAVSKDSSNIFALDKLSPEDKSKLGLLSITDLMTGYDTEKFQKDVQEKFGGHDIMEYLSGLSEKDLKNYLANITFGRDYDAAKDDKGIIGLMTPFTANRAVRSTSEKYNKIEDDLVQRNQFNRYSTWRKMGKSHEEAIESLGFNATQSYRDLGEKFKERFDNGDFETLAGEYTDYSKYKQSFDEGKKLFGEENEALSEADWKAKIDNLRITGKLPWEKIKVDTAKNEYQTQVGDEFIKELAKTYGIDYRSLSENQQAEILKTVGAKDITSSDFKLDIPKYVKPGSVIPSDYTDYDAYKKDAEASGGTVLSREQFENVRTQTPAEKTQEAILETNKELLANNKEEKKEIEQVVNPTEVTPETAVTPTEVNIEEDKTGKKPKAKKKEKGNEGEEVIVEEDKSQTAKATVAPNDKNGKEMASSLQDIFDVEKYKEAKKSPEEKQLAYLESMDQSLKFIRSGQGKSNKYQESIARSTAYTVDAARQTTQAVAATGRISSGPSYKNVPSLLT